MRTTPLTEMAVNSRVPVVNALSDFEHPCQALADFMTLEEQFGAAAGLNFAYVGDGNNVCHSLMLTGAQLGANVIVARRAATRRHRDRDQGAGDRRGARLRDSPAAGSAGRREGADAVYTDVCVSMGMEHESTKRAPIFRPSR